MNNELEREFLQLKKIVRQLRKENKKLKELNKTPYKEFSYCIGKPWYGKKNKELVSVYTYGQTVFLGDIEDAKNVEEFVQKRANYDKSKKEKFYIYKLVKVELDKNNKK